jgi:hypothetical protein
MAEEQRQEHEGVTMTTPPQASTRRVGRTTTTGDAGEGLGSLLPETPLSLSSLHAWYCLCSVWGGVGQRRCKATWPERFSPSLESFALGLESSQVPWLASLPATRGRRTMPHRIRCLELGLTSQASKPMQRHHDVLGYYCYGLVAPWCRSQWLS